MKNLDLILMILIILSFTSLAAAIRDVPSGRFSHDTMAKTTLPFTQMKVSTVSGSGSDLLSPHPLAYGVSPSSPPPPPSPPQSLPLKLSLHFHFNLTLKIVLPIGIATTVSIIGWVSYKCYKSKPTTEGLGGGVAPIEIQMTN